MYIYYNHENNVPSRLSPQWLCGNSCTWAHDVRFMYIYKYGLRTVYIYIYIYIYMYIYVYIYVLCIYIMYILYEIYEIPKTKD